jgi:G3E family GTPase
MHVNLLFGFLGSGKTTLVKRILAKRDPGSKTAVIVNEFGEVGIDGDILRGQNVDMVELNSGCMCCTLRGSLMLAVEELRTKAGVDRIVVEATGVAQPGELLDTLADRSLKQDFEVGPIVTVVDVAKFPKLDAMLGEFYEAQIEDADLVVLNKIDLATPEQREEVKRRVADINPAAEILFAEQADVDIGTVFGEEKLRGARQQGVLITPFRRFGMHQPSEGPHGHEAGEPHTHLDDLPVETFAVTIPFQTQRSAVEALFSSLGDSIWRAKGFIQLEGGTALIQYAAGQLEISPAPRRSSHELVFIGHDMDRAAVELQIARLQPT